MAAANVPTSGPLTTPAVDVPNASLSILTSPRMSAVAVVPSAVEALQQIIAQQAALIQQHAALIQQQAALIQVQAFAYTELQAGSEPQAATLRSLPASEAGEQRRLRVSESMVREAEGSEESTVSVLEVLEFRRWKKEFCEGETRSLIVRLELARGVEHGLRVENERLRALIPNC